jgi:thioredoxin-like negative regulator of GroEL
MKRNIVAPAGGLIILAGGLALAFYTATSAPALKETKAKTIKKYISQAENALKKGDKSEAMKFIKRALVVDAKNKEAIAEFKKIVLLDCKTAPTQTQSNTTPTQTKTQAKPEAEADDEMGCI